MSYCGQKRLVCGGDELHRMVGTWINFQSEKIGGNYGIVLKKLMLFKFFYFKHCWYISPKCINT